jgi:AcrR family transcriptional regulator
MRRMTAETGTTTSARGSRQGGAVDGTDGARRDAAAGSGQRGRPRGLSARVRRDVHEAVRELLVTVGYSALRFEEVAAKAGVHKTTLYRQWDTKAQLVREVLTASEVAYYPRPDEGSWDADLEALCRGLARLFRSPTTIAFVKTQAMANDPELITGLRELAARDMTFVRLPFERALARGDLDPDIDIDMLMELVIAPFLARVAVTELPTDDRFAASLAATIRAIGRPRSSAGATARCSEISSQERGDGRGPGEKR